MMRKKKIQKLRENLQPQSDTIDMLQMFNEFWEGQELDSWCWTDEFVILGSDVSSLFPSLSAGRTSKAVRNQY